MHDFSSRAVNPGDARRLASGLGHTKYSLAAIDEVDDALGCPGARGGSVGANGAQDLRRSAVPVDLLQLAVGGEPERAAVGRPEWEVAVFRSRQRPRFKRIQGPHPERGAAAGDHSEYELATVGRY